MSIKAVMEISKDEEIAATLVGGHIQGTGRYKFIAKKKLNNKFEWAHFVERDNGLKENVYRGEVASTEELNLVISISNKTLIRIFGAHAEMKMAQPEFRSLTGQKFDDSIN